MFDYVGPSTVSYWKRQSYKKKESQLFKGLCFFLGNRAPRGVPCCTKQFTETLPCLDIVVVTQPLSQHLKDRFGPINSSVLSSLLRPLYLATCTSGICTSTCIWA